MSATPEQLAQLAKLKVGDEVVICRGGHHERAYLFGYTVRNISPTGRITVSKKIEGGIVEVLVRRFNSEGYDLGGHGSRPSWIETDVARFKGNQ